jgi:N-acetylmuramoyl-L-alanine amidase
MQGAMTIKRFFSLIIAGFCLSSAGFAQKADQPYRMKTIVIDAGHGGNDPGNLGTGRYKAKEKDIALDVALKVGSLIKETFPSINVRYTRDKDVFIGLNERADLANKADADLFLSIHCNAAQNSSAQGVETFALGLHRSEENLQVAMKENQAIFLEDDYQTKYEGFDPNSPESIIALTIMQSAFLEQSLRISSYIQQQFKERVGRKDRGVKQAGFLVLRRTTMPSILIELGFLTNASEEDFLNTEDGRTYMASAIFRGFRDYKDKVEGVVSATKTEEATPKSETPVAVEQKPKSEAVKENRQETAKPVEPPVQSAADIEKSRKLKELEAAKAEKDRLEKLKLEQDLVAQKKAREDQKKKEEVDRLAKEKVAKEQELADSKKNAEAEEKARIAEKLKREAVAEQARVEFAERLAAIEKGKQDSLQKVHAEQREKRLKQEEVKPVNKIEEQQTKKEIVPQLADRPLTPDEAELLYLEKRKMELEARIAQVNKTKSPSQTEQESKNMEQKPQPALVPVESKEVVTKSSSQLIADKGVVLSVQILSSANPIDVNSPRFKGQPARYYVQDGLYKYIVGSFTSFASVTAEQTRLRKLGFEGAFVVAFKDGVRIKADEARAVLK